MGDGNVARPRRGREVEVPDQTEFIADLDRVLDGLRTLLIEKNKNYGDSALNPVRITTKADPRELLTARFDDKLKRLQMGNAAGEDVWADIRGYAILIAIYDLREERKAASSTG